MRNRRSAAHQLLDQVQAGSVNIHLAAITKALQATGDIPPCDDEPVRRIRQPGTWERSYPAAEPATWLDALAPLTPCAVGLESAS
jgi:hypothetical protein